AGAAENSRGRSVWVDRAAMVRAPLRPGPGAWRNSTWPR
ncbi:MAG: acyl-CoA carboxylase subunit epsilon, partial [Actinomycetota bacterium]|nr:acyl-CoA carboxylase subunit epsilon [Actinomycetota bacterium]